MFVLPLKAGVPTAIDKALAEWLDRDSPGVSELDSNASSLSTVKRQRSLVALKTVPNPPTETYLHDLHLYHRTLLSLESSGFPTTDSDIPNLSVTWSCAFTSKPCTRSNVRADRLAVLYNAAAAAAHLAGVEPRSDERSLKSACHGFQSAAGQLSHLRSVVSGDGASCAPSTLDLDPECLSMCEGVMLAQAQACVYEKAKSGGSMKRGVLAKIAMGAHEMYHKAWEGARARSVQGKIDKGWEDGLRQQALMFRAAAEYWEGLAAGAKAKEKGEGYGVEVARLGECLSYAERAIIHGGKCKLDVTPVQQLKAACTERHQEAAADNKTIYLEGVPPGRSLPPVKSATLVKPLPLAASLTAAPDTPLFPSLLPRPARLAVERLQESLASSLSNLEASASSLSAAARSDLNAVDLPQSLEAHLAGDCLPAGVWESVSGAQALSPRRALASTKATVDASAAACRGRLESAKAALDEWRDDDARFKAENPGYEGTRDADQSAVRAALDHYADLLSNAGRSDLVVAASLEADGTRRAVATLEKTRAELDAGMPSRGGIGAKEIDAGELKGALLALTRLMAERDERVARFRSDVEAFDFKSAVSAVQDRTPAGYQKACDEALGRFDAPQIEVAGMEEAQAGLLARIMALNDAFRRQRGADEVTRRREEYVAGVEASVAAFRALYDQLVEGRNFYRSLEERLAKTEQAAKDQGISVRIAHQDYLDMKERKERSLSQELADAELAKRLATELGADDSLRRREEQLNRDAQYAASLVAMEEQSRENEEALVQLEREKEKAPPKPKKGEADNSWGSWFGSLGGSKDQTEEKTGLSQPLTAPPAPAPLQGYPGSSNDEAPPVPPPSFAAAQRGAPIYNRTERAGSYEPPSIGPNSVVSPPPPSFEEAQLQAAMKISGGGAAPPPPADVDESKVGTLREMGFSDSDVRTALAMHRNDQEAALNQLLSG